MSDFLKKEGKPIDVQDLSDELTPAQRLVQKVATDLGSGVYHTALREGYPEYDDAPCEKVIKGDNNAFVILGRDRPYSMASGMGAKGGKCGRIHLIAGLAAASELKEGSQTGPNLITDAATVYISQRTSIDEFFGIPAGTNVPAKDKSGIGIKADHVRIIGREHVKIYAGSAQNISKPNKAVRNVLGLNRERNSKGGDVTSRGCIDLIADNYNDIQPAVKGQNLVEFLQVILDTIGEIYAEINDINARTIEINNALLLHQHPEFLGIGGTPGPALTVKILSNYPSHFKSAINSIVSNINLAIDEINYIQTDLPAVGARHILSDSVYIT
jgi:hypothetical protein